MHLIYGMAVIAVVIVVLAFCIYVGKILGDGNEDGYRQYLEQTALKVSMYLNVESSEFEELLRRITAREDVTTLNQLTDEELIKFINAYGAVRGIKVY